MLKRTELIAKLAGQPTQTLPHYFTEKARKVPLNSVLPYDEWYNNVKDDIEYETRFEFIAYDEDDKVIGAMVFARDYDPCVGDLLVVRFAYSEEPKALTQGYRLLNHVAKHLRFKHVRYTQLIKGKEYRDIYKEVKLPPIVEPVVEEVVEPIIEQPVVKLNKDGTPRKKPGRKPKAIEPLVEENIGTNNTGWKIEL